MELTQVKISTPLVATTLLLALVGCSGGNPPPAGATSPRISVAEDAPTAAGKSELDLATEFVTSVYADDWDQASTMVADNTVAARYVTHQAAAAQVDDLNGNANQADPSDIDVTPDEDTKTVTIEDRSVDPTSTRVWDNFTFEAGKVASWNVQGSPNLPSRLWSTKSSDESEGVSAELVSAYQANNRNLTVVVRLKSRSKNVRVMGAEYTPTDGFKHEDTASLDSDVDKEGKALLYFIFRKAPVGGKLKLTVDKIDSGDSSYSDYLTTLNLKGR